jgi:hypothetical protein
MQLLATTQFKGAWSFKGSELQERLAAKEPTHGTSNEDRDHDHYHFRLHRRSLLEQRFGYL